MLANINYVKMGNGKWEISLLGKLSSVLKKKRIYKYFYNMLDSTCSLIMLTNRKI